MRLRIYYNLIMLRKKSIRGEKSKEGDDKSEKSTTKGWRTSMMLQRT